jgi:hypothetical protein
LVPGLVWGKPRGGRGRRAGADTAGGEAAPADLLQASSCQARCSAQDYPHAAVCFPIPLKWSGDIYLRQYISLMHNLASVANEPDRLHSLWGKRVCLRAQVRKCFCDVSTCARKIFAERLTSFVEPLARVTVRLFQVVQALGLATGGMLGARLAERLGIRTSWMTILRRIMALSQAPAQPVRELGIDDFAFRRGRRFCTLLVDLISHQVVDVLPDRKAETAAAWMRAHPEIELVSRDRGGDYAAGARQGAPQAI